MNRNRVTGNKWCKRNDASQRLIVAFVPSTSIHGNIKFHLELTHTQRKPPSSGSMHRTSFSTGSGIPSSSGNAVAQQQHLMRNHTDAITSIVLTEVPYPMVISGDRDGVIKVVS